MILRRAREVLDRVRSELHRSFTEEYTSRETAGSFSLGVFITMLPTLGTGLLAFFVLAWAFDRVNKVAMFASVIVFNPVVKWGVYGTSFALGTSILGPIPGVTPSSVSLSAGPPIVVRLVLGNVILAILAAVASYAASYRIVRAYERREFGVVDAVTNVVGADEDADGDGAAPADAPSDARTDGAAPDETHANAPTEARTEARTDARTDGASADGGSREDADEGDD